MGGRGGGAPNRKNEQNKAKRGGFVRSLTIHAIIYHAKPLSATYSTYGTVIKTANNMSTVIYILPKYTYCSQHDYIHTYTVTKDTSHFRRHTGIIRTNNKQLRRVTLVLETSTKKSKHSNTTIAVRSSQESRVGVVAYWESRAPYCFPGIISATRQEGKAVGGPVMLKSTRTTDATMQLKQQCHDVWSTTCSSICHIFQQRQYRLVTTNCNYHPWTASVSIQPYTRTRTSEKKKHNIHNIHDIHIRYISYDVSIHPI